jgi:hypothetical protein
MVLYIALEKSAFQLPFLHKKEEPEQLIEEKKYKKDTEWAETKGRSSYGAPVLFRDEPDEEVTPSFAKAMADRPDFTQSSDVTQDVLHDTVDEETIDQNESVEQSNNQQSARETTQGKKQTEEPVEEKLDINSSVAKAMENKQDATSIQTIAPQQEFLQNKTALTKTMQNPLKTTRQQSHSTPPSRTGLSAVASPVLRSFSEGGAKAGKPIAMTKKTPSLAQLTQGVLNYVKDEGQYAVSMIGKKGGVPSDEQMKYERFLQKLSHCLQTAFSINNDKFPQCDPSVNSIEIFLALNKDGTLHNLRLVKTSGDPRVDAFMMFAFRDASSSFPTVPHYLPHNPFSITYVIDISPTRSNMGIYRR